ncbi:hypothetical protein [Rhizobium sp. L43]|uniref:hypothetical protein n=1 Tax=Rhizobium sp. L43 TaxID=2035452 RepID=UPI000BE8C630|nr:hypothetical protein [Rhizobium sp. L43]PDS79627.1 hypothetical protein CO667_08615 [Rhizobium sp. L43]
MEIKSLLGQMKEYDSLLGYLGILIPVWSFWLRREYAKKIEFDISANILWFQNEPYIVEFDISLDNKGKVKIKIPYISLSVRTLHEGDEYSKFKQSHLNFPTKLIDMQNILIGEDFDFTFVEPGIKQHYRFVAEVPKEAKYLLATGKFEYRKGWPHTTSRLIQLYRQR